MCRNRKLPVQASRYVNSCCVCLGVEFTTFSVNSLLRISYLACLSQGCWEHKLLSTIAVVYPKTSRCWHTYSTVHVPSKCLCVAILLGACVIIAEKKYLRNIPSAKVDAYIGLYLVVKCANKFANSGIAVLETAS